MRFNEKHYPILAKINNLNDLKGYSENGFIDRSLEMYPQFSVGRKLAKHCKAVYESKTIDFVSVPFFEKVTNGKVFEKLTELFNELEPCEGVLLYPKKRFSKIHAVSYSIIKGANNKELKVELHLYSEVGRIVTLYVDVVDKINWNAVISSSIKKNSKGEPISQEQINDWFINHIQTCLSILTFKQYAEIETKHIGGKKYPRKVQIEKEKYLNECSETINVLDSRWFTTTVRSDGFKVSGHFRLQPYGPGLKDRKLIYIKDFEKKGYTRKARIE